MRAANRRLVALLVSDGTTLLGAAMAVTATPFVVLAAGGDKSALAWVSAAVLAVELVSLAGGGLLADRVPRQWVMMAADLVQAASAAILAVAFARGVAGVSLVVAMSALRGLGLGLFLPASQGILPQIVDVSVLGRSNSARRVVANVAQIGGALAGGVLVASAGPATALAVITGVFLVGALARVGLRGLGAVSADGESLLKAAVGGFREFASRRWLWSVVAGFALINAAFIGVASVLGPLMVTEQFKGASSWGVVAAATAIGAVVGAAAAFSWRPRRPLFVAILFAALIGLEPLALATSPFPLILAAAFAAGFGIEVFGIQWVSALQAHIPGDALSRVSAFDAMGSFAVSPLGPLAAAGAAGAMGVSVSLALSGVVIFGLCGLLLVVPEVRGLGRVADPASGLPGSPVPDRAPVSGKGRGRRAPRSPGPGSAERTLEA